MVGLHLSETEHDTPIPLPRHLLSPFQPVHPPCPNSEASRLPTIHHHHLPHLRYLICFRCLSLPLVLQLLFRFVLLLPELLAAHGFHQREVPPSLCSVTLLYYTFDFGKREFSMTSSIQGHHRRVGDRRTLCRGALYRRLMVEPHLNNPRNVKLDVNFSCCRLVNHIRLCCYWISDHTTFFVV